KHSFLDSFSETTKPSSRNGRLFSTPGASKTVQPFGNGLMSGLVLLNIYARTKAFTDCRRPLAALVRHGGFVLWRICSLQVRHRTDSLRRAVRSLLETCSKSFNLLLLLGYCRLLFLHLAMCFKIH